MAKRSRMHARNWHTIAVLVSDGRIGEVSQDAETAYDFLQVGVLLWIFRS